MPLFNFIKEYKDFGIKGSFSHWYDKNTRETRMDEMREYATEVARHIKDGANVLELDPGPGYMSIELAKMGNYNITGLDISPDMVTICKQNAEREKVNINFIEGNIITANFNEESFDFIFCSAAFKNFKAPILTLRTMCRVLKKGGIAFIADLRRDLHHEALEEEINKTTKPGFERLMVTIRFKGLIRYAYTRDEVLEMIKGTSFERHEIRETEIGFYVYLYK
jgi:ubiquinone/menaquinone biosynthesis C-methylase UbiE